MKKLFYFLLFLFLPICIFANTNLIFIPYAGSESFYENSSMTAVKTKDKIESYADKLDLTGRGYTKGGLLLYSKNNFNFTLYNLNSYRQIIGFDSGFPIDIYPVATGDSQQSFTQLALHGNFTQIKKNLYLQYYIKGSYTKGNRNLHNYKTSPNKLNSDTFDFEKKTNKQDLYFPHYRLKYNQKELAPKIGLNFEFEKVKVGFFLGSLSTETKGTISGNAFAIDRDKKPDFDLNNFGSYIKYNSSYNEDYEYIRNGPLSRTIKKSNTEALMRFSLSLLKLAFPNNPLFETSIIELYYSPNDFTYSQRTNVLFHPNLGFSLGLIYLQSGKKNVNLSIQRNYEIGPLFRYGF